MRNPANIALAVLSALIFIAGGVLLLQIVDGDAPEAAIVVGEEAFGSDVTLGHVRGRGVWGMSVRDARPGIHQTRISIDGGAPVVMANPAQLVFDTAVLQEGPHTFVVDVVDRSLRRNATSISGTFISDNTPPVLTIAAASLQAQQGHTLALYVRTSEPVDGFRGGLLKQERVFHALDGGAKKGGGLHFRALVGVPVDARLGRIPLELRARDLAGNVRRAFVAIDVADGKFKRGGLIRLTAEQEKARGEGEKIRAANVARGEAYATVIPQQLWSAPFIKPVAGRRTSTFGKYRTYSDGKKKHHFGVDIANRTGTPVHVAAAGEVVLAEQQQIYGNVVIVHHGQGVSTSYNHLHSIDVTVGEELARGKRVGTVGSTGQSTGPHLHWGMVVDRTAVNAEQWVGEEFSPPPGDEGWVPVADIELKRKSS
jgi:murein DD-endopeptidase MepM/ murein hydrolase activator NlpD